MKLNAKNDVYLLMNAATLSAALGAAIETGLLWRLAAKPMNAQEVAQALNIPGKRCHYWLQVLDELGILQNGPDGYAPSSLAREAILDVHSQESWQHLALDERERSAGAHNLPLFISEPGSIWAAQGLAEPMGYVEKMRASPARAREFNWFKQALMFRLTIRLFVTDGSSFRHGKKGHRNGRVDRSICSPWISRLRLNTPPTFAGRTRGLWSQPNFVIECKRPITLQRAGCEATCFCVAGCQINLAERAIVTGQYFNLDARMWHVLHLLIVS